MQLNLKDQVVLVTGASGGLGAAVTAAFLKASARVAGVSRSIKDWNPPTPSFSAVPAEISSLEQACSVVNTVTAKWGRIDALVHLIGGFEGGRRVEESDDAGLDRMLNINLRVAYHMIRAVLPGMRERQAGRILAIGSRTAIEPAATLGLYSASKAALVSLIRTVAIENKDRGITANIILPSTMDTPANRTAMPQADFSRWIQPAQVAAMLVHLAGDHASQINGAAIPIYGSDL